FFFLRMFPCFLVQRVKRQCYRFNYKLKATISSPIGIEELSKELYMTKEGLITFILVTTFVIWLSSIV
ncbi:hypothetical protein ACJX0J_033571, partial [Zea mays]